MPFPLAAVGLGTQLLGGLFGAFSRNKMAKMQLKMAAEQQAKADAAFAEAKGHLDNNISTAKNIFNGRMAGATNAEQNIMGSAANSVANVNRNATSGSQAIAAAAGIGAGADQAMVDLATREAQNKTANAGLLANAEGGMAGLMGQRSSDFDNKAQSLAYAGMGNKANATQGLVNTGMMFGNALMGARGTDGNPYQFGNGQKFDWGSIFGV